MELPHWHLVGATLMHVCLGFTVFYYMSILDNPLGPMRQWIKTLANTSITAHYGLEPNERVINYVWSAVNGCIIIGAMIGSLIMNWVAEKFGRRNTAMALNNLALICASVLQYFSRPLNSIELLLIGCVFSGISVIFASFIAVYLAESTLPEHRGLVSSFAINVGSHLWLLIGAFVALYVSESNWHYAFLCPLLPSLIHLALTPVMPKSVKYLYITKGKTETARKASRFYSGTDAQRNQLEVEMDREADIAPTIRDVSLTLLFDVKQFKWPLFICVVANLMAPFGGFEIANFYASNILLKVGMVEHRIRRYSVTFLYLPSFFLSILSVYLIEKMGRRFMLLTSVGLGIIGTAMLAIISPLELISITASSFSAALGLCIILIGNTLGSCVIGYVLYGELVPQATRSLTVGIGGFLTYLVCFITAFIFPFMNEYLESYFVLTFVIAGVVGFIFLYKYLPETKGKTVAELVARWMPTRKNADVAGPSRLATISEETWPLIPKKKSKERY